MKFQCKGYSIVHCVRFDRDSTNTRTQTGAYIDINACLFLPSSIRTINNTFDGKTHKQRLILLNRGSSIIKKHLHSIKKDSSIIHHPCDRHALRASIACRVRCMWQMRPGRKPRVLVPNMAVSDRTGKLAIRTLCEKQLDREIPIVKILTNALAYGIEGLKDKSDRTIGFRYAPGDWDDNAKKCKTTWQKWPSACSRTNINEILTSLIDLPSSSTNLVRDSSNNPGRWKADPGGWQGQLEPAQDPLREIQVWN